MMNVRRPRVLVLALSFGSGHMRAARAVAAEIRRQSPGAQVRVIDALAEASLAFRAVYAWPYWAMLRWAPSLWRRLFASRIRHVSRHTAPAALFRIGCRRVFKTIQAFDPDTIVAAEVGACEIGVIARRARLTRASIAAVITDAAAEPAWVAPEVERYAVATAEVRDQLVGWGASPSSVSVTGIPVDGAFVQAVQVHPLAPGESPRVLLMGGGMGPTRMDLVAAQLCASRTPMRIVAVAGHDRRALARLRRIAVTVPTTLSVVGWTDGVAILMRSADVLVTKPGGLTMAEAAACGVPLVLFDPIPGPEEENAGRAAREGAALVARDSRATADAVLRLLKDAGRRAEMRKHAARLALPGAAAAIADIALALARGGSGAKVAPAGVPAQSPPPAWEAGA